MTDQKNFVASDEAKAKAGQFRLFAVIAWLIAIAGEVFTIYKIKHTISGENILTFLIIAIIIILILAVVGNLLWKKAGRLDPPSEKNKVEFFLKSQLGAILSVAAFLPLVIVIFTSKNLDGKTKGIAGAIAVVALLIGFGSGIQTAPPSIEKYSKQIQEQTDSLKQIAPNAEFVYWIGEAGKIKDSTHKYHINEDCQYIKEKENVQKGTIKDAFSNNGESELCKVCKARALKENEIPSENLLEQVQEAVTGDSVQ